MPLASRARANLLALCQRIVPAAYDENNPAAMAALATRVEERIAALDAAPARQIGLVLALLERRLTGLLLSGRPVRFRSLSDRARDRYLERWSTHRSVLARGAFQALRRLILWTYWSDPLARSTIGWLGPFHQRAALVASEGAMPGRAAPADPVYRGERDARPEVPRARVPVLARPRGGIMRADVCVIGSGAGGAVAAAGLAEAGREVVVLEAGPPWAPADSDEDEAAMVARLYAEQGTRATTDQSILLFQGECLGGGTTVNWMLMLRPPAHVMDEWSRDGGAELLGAASLVPALERIEAEVGARLVPEDAHSAQNRALLRGARALGWAVEPARINARDCVRAGTCGLGCRWGAKQSATETYLPRAIAAGARVVCDAPVQRIERAAAGLHRVACAARAGAPAFAVEAQTVVLAAGAVGTPAILRRSGVGNANVGRFLRLHPTTAVVGRYDAEMYGGAGIPQSSLCTEFLGVNGGYGYWIECPPFQPALASVGLPGFGMAHAERMREYRQLGAFIVLVRDGAARGQSQGEIRVDWSGRAAVRYRLGPAEKLRAAEGIAAAAEIHLAAGAQNAFALSDAPFARTVAEARALAGIALVPNRIAMFSAHVNGTCRMGGNARDSACDPDGRLRGARNVYVADGSLFPTAPAANPQATIMAVASLVASRVRGP